MILRFIKQLKKKWRTKQRDKKFLGSRYTGVRFYKRKVSELFLRDIEYYTWHYDYLKRERCYVYSDCEIRKIIEDNIFSLPNALCCYSLNYTNHLATIYRGLR